MRSQSGVQVYKQHEKTPEQLNGKTKNITKQIKTIYAES